MAPPLMAVLPVAPVVRLVSAVVPPTAAANVVAPEAFSVRSCAPLTVEVNVRLLALSTALAPRVTASP